MRNRLDDELRTRFVWLSLRWIGFYVKTPVQLGPMATTIAVGANIRRRSRNQYVNALGTTGFT